MNFQILKSFYSLVKFIVNIRADKVSNKNIAENSTEVSLKTSSDFQSPSNHQELQLSTEFDGSTISACFLKNPRKFNNKTG